MSTRIMLSVAGAEVGASKTYDLADDFDAVLGRIVPTQAPSSSLEHRVNCTHTLKDGGRVYVHPQLVATIEELVDA